MFQELIMPAFGALLLVGWTASGAWAVRPAATNRMLTEQKTAGQDLAVARAARGLTRNGLLGALIMLGVAFMAVHLFFGLSGWFQLAWVIAALAAAYTVWRVTLLWPDRRVEQARRHIVTAHSMRPVRLPWGMITVAAALVAVWFVPPMILY